jgi:hypothetical protein
MKSQTATPTTSKRTDENLDGRYGKIGIPAVAAAVQYKCDAKNPAYAPVVPQHDDRYAEASA